MQAFVLSLVLVCTVHASGQEGAVLPVPAQELLRRGLPGAQPGTERWMVTFADRSFDLAEFRTLSLRNAQAAEVDPVVARYELQVRSDQAGFVEEVERMG